MKKYILILLSLSLLSCEKELFFGSDFQFSFENTGNLDDEIQFNQTKQFDIKLFDLISINENQEFDLKVSFSSGNGEIIIDNKLLEENVYFKINPINKKVNINFIPKEEGNITIVFKLKNNYNLEKQQTITFKVKKNNFDYTFLISPLTIDTNVFQDNSLTINIKNLDNSSDKNFKIKYSSTGNGELKNGSNIFEPNTFYDFKEGIINLIYNSKSIGTQKLYFNCKNSLNEEKEIIVILNVNPVPFNLVKGNDFTNKETLFSDFSFVLNNIIPNTEYFIKIESKQNARIWKNINHQIPLNEFYPLNINSSNTYSFKYELPIREDNSETLVTNDELILSIKDKFNQVKSIIYNVTYYPKPTITNVKKELLSTNPQRYRVQLNYILHGGAVYKDYEYIQYNNITSSPFNAFVDTSNNYNNFNITSNSYFSGVFITTYVSRSFIRIKDSDGALSDWIPVK